MIKLAFFKSSLVKKYWMAITGLFLVTFLIAHLIGNLQLLKGDNGEAFNVYAAFMTSNPLIKILSYLTYFSVLFHAVDGLILTLQNWKASPKKYVKNKPSANSKWASRNMGLLGTIILVFIVTHMSNFWAKMHFDESMHTTEINGRKVKDLYEIVVKFFTSETTGAIATAFYVLSMIAMGFHLIHGFKSAFQTLGLNHAKYNGLIKQLGILVGVIIPALFALIPIVIFMTK